MQKVFPARAAPRGVCGTLSNALKLLAHQQRDSLVKVLVAGFQGRSRLKMMDGLRRFIMVDNREAVRVGELEKIMESR